MSKWIMFVFLFVLSCGDMSRSTSCTIDGEDCRKANRVITQVKNGSSCSVSETDSFIKVSCTDGTESIINKPKNGQSGSDGKDGADGVDGSNGSDGYSIVFLITDSQTCATGGKMILLAQDTNRNGVLDLSGDSGLQSADACNGATGETGQKGDKGDTGEKGEVGETGQTGSQGDKGDTGETGSQGETGSKGDKGDTGEKGDKGDTGAAGQDGADGANGQDAPVSLFSTVTVIDPCGDKSGVYDEVLLKLADGSILASFSDDANGKNTRFSLLVPGSYMTTDGSKCYFTVNSNMAVVNQHY
jgi:hypothetical protein